MSEQQVQQLDEIITQRRGRYGPLIESGEVAMKLEDYLRSLPGWERLAYDQRESLAMVMHKISRIMCGDPNYDDSWVDIAGYAQNVVNRLRAEQAKPQTFEEHLATGNAGLDFKHVALVEKGPIPDCKIYPTTSLPDGEA